MLGPEIRMSCYISVSSMWIWRLLFSEFFKKIVAYHLIRSRVSSTHLPSSQPTSLSYVCYTPIPHHQHIWTSSILITLAYVKGTSMTITFRVCAVLRYSWWRIVDLSETRRVLYQKIWEIVHLVGFHYKNNLFGSRYLRMQLSQLFPDKFFVRISYVSHLNCTFDQS